MIRKLILGILSVALLVFGWWFFRPFSEYSPAEVILDREFGDRTVTYRSMEEVFPYRQIEGAASPLTLPVAGQMSDIVYEWQGDTKPLQQFVDDANVTALLVVKDGKIVFEKYYHGEEADSRHTSWSVAKSYIATLIGIAVKEGRISSLDDPVEKYAPQFQDTDYGKATIRHLLMMSSGIDFIEDYDVRGSDIRKLFFNVFILNRDVDNFVRRYKQGEQPGQRFNYLSTDTQVLAAVVRGAFGEPVADVAQEKIFEPLGMEGATWLTDRNAGDAKTLGYCCLNSRARDFAKFGLLYLNDGVWNGAQLLPEGWADFVQTPPTKDHTPGPMGSGKRGYGHHFWLPEGTDGEFFASGFNGQHIWIDQKNGIVVVKTAADENAQARMPEIVAVFRALTAQAMVQD